MSLAKRVQLMSSGPLESKKQEPKPVPRAVRLTIKLGETTDDYFPCINYKELLGRQLKKLELREKKGVVDASSDEDPFSREEDAENDKLVEIARKFEEKYGQTSKRRPRVDDYEELADGYDESDSFIDNTEALDEAMPEDVSPALGGFYINKGRLETRKNDDLFRFSRKGGETALVSSDSEDGDRPKERKNTECSDTTDASSVKKSGKHRKDKHKSPKKKSKKDKKHPEKKLPKTTDDSSSSVSDTIETVINKAQNNEINTPKVKGREDGIKNSVADALKLKVKKDLNAKVRKASSGPSEEKEILSPVSKTSAGKHKLPDKLPLEIAKPVVKIELPPTLPDEIGYLVGCLKNEHEECVRDRKAKKERSSDDSEGEEEFSMGGKMFPESMKTNLMKLEKACRGLDVEHRTQVFTYLGSTFEVKADDMRRKSRDLVKEEEDRRLLPYLSQLKKAVDATMPELEKRHQNKCKATAEGRTEEQNSDYESEEEKGDKPKTRMPRRKFIWNEDVRETFLDVVRIKVKMFEEDQSPGLDPENYLKDFFEQRVKIIWPKNWMNARELYRESKNVHSHLTNKTRRGNLPLMRKSGPQLSIPAPSMSPVSSGVQHRNSSSPAASGPPTPVVSVLNPVKTSPVAEPSVTPTSMPSGIGPSEMVMNAMKVFMNAGNYGNNAASLLNEETLRAMMGFGMNPAGLSAMLPGFGAPAKQPSTKRQSSSDERRPPEKRRKTDPTMIPPVRNQTPPSAIPSSSPSLTVTVSPPKIQSVMKQDHDTIVLPRVNLTQPSPSNEKSEDDVKRISPRGEFRPSTPDIKLYSMGGMGSKSNSLVSPSSAIAASRSQASVKQHSSPKSSVSMRVSTPNASSSTSAGSMLGAKAPLGLEVTQIPKISNVTTSPEVYKPHKRPVLESSMPVSSSLSGSSRDSNSEGSKGRSVVSIPKSTTLTLTQIERPQSSTAMERNPSKPVEGYDLTIPLLKPSSRPESRSIPSLPAGLTVSSASSAKPRSTPLPKQSPLDEAKMSLPILSLGSELSFASDLSTGFGDLSQNMKADLADGAVDYSSQSRPMIVSSSTSKSQPIIDLSSPDSQATYQSKKMQAAAIMKTQPSSHNLDYGNLIQQEIIKQLSPEKQASNAPSRSSAIPNSTQAHKSYSTSVSSGYSAHSSQRYQSQSSTSSQPTSTTPTYFQEGLGSRVPSNLSGYNISPTSQKSSATSANYASSPMSGSPTMRISSSSSSGSYIGSTSSPTQRSSSSSSLNYSNAAQRSSSTSGNYLSSTAPVTSYKTTSSAAQNAAAATMRDYRHQRAPSQGSHSLTQSKQITSAQRSGSFPAPPSRSSSAAGQLAAYYTKASAGSEGVMQAYQDASTLSRYHPTSSEARIAGSSSQGNLTASQPTTQTRKTYEQPRAVPQPTVQSYSTSTKQMFSNDEQQNVSHPGYYTSPVYRQHQQQSHTQNQCFDARFRLINWGHNLEIVKRLDVSILEEDIYAPALQ
ncbi:unnamed protein product [Notodromas monacha]|uniref:Ubinuclein-1 n=1 Tax=Notodromas monacha TaxID=399045 RepID=A0A7R9BGE7_9CRUS|nr:unnamed protein product [Notodromas monacha]CAG0913950.1 unnamed protein product [Notodromas monacha]